MTKLNLSSKARTQMILRALLAPLLMIGLLFFVAGRWDFWQAWVYAIINLIVLLLNHRPFDIKRTRSTRSWVLAGRSSGSTRSWRERNDEK